MISILDPTTLVGRDFVAALLESSPGQALRYAHTGEDHEHLITEVGGGASIVPHLADVEELHGSRVVVVTVPPPEPTALALLAWLRENPGTALVDLSQPGIAGDMATTVLDPGDRLRGASRLFHLADPCVYSPVWAVRALDALTPRRAAITLIRPASTWGEDALHELAAQAALRLSGSPPGKASRLPGVLAFDLAPAHADETFALAGQIRTALAGIDATALVADGGVFHGHAASLTVEFERPVTPAEVRSRLGMVPRLRIARSNQKVSLASAVAETGIVCAGLTVAERTAAMWLVCDGIREGVVAVGVELTALLSGPESDRPRVH